MSLKLSKANTIIAISAGKVLKGSIAHRGAKLAESLF